MTVTRPTLRASFEVNLCPILKTNTPLQMPCNQLNEDGENPKRNDFVTVVRN